MDRPVGSLVVDPNGFANYSFPISVPPGAGHGNEPNISLNFSHGMASTGILGSKWSLGGLSNIILVLPSVAVNNSSKTRDINCPFRYALDGSELLCTNGTYGTPGSTYMKELDDGNATVVTYNSDDSFTVTNQFGCRSLYGSTSSSRIVNTATGGSAITIEWKLSKAYDSRSNYVQYSYQSAAPVTSSTQLSTTTDFGITYLSCIQYTSNDVLGYTGKMKVNFQYDTRSDPVKATVWGSLTCTAHLLTTISTTVDSADGLTSYPARAYKLAYSQSPATGDSLLTSVTEYGSAGTGLASTVFEYTGVAPAEWKEKLFSQSQTVKSLDNTLGAQSLLSINMTGRGYTDLACLQFDSGTNQMNLVPFIGNPIPDNTGSDWTTDWTAIEGNSTVFLADVQSADQTSLVVTDVDRDGRTDIILAYNVSGLLQFSIAKSNGSGFDPAIQLPTSQSWMPSSRFFAVDASGDGTMDIVQITSTPDGTQQICTFFDVNANLQSSIMPVVSSDTWQDNSTVINWFPIQKQRQNAASLVQITQALADDGSNVVTANIFTATNDQLFSQNPFAQSKSILLKSYMPDPTTEVSVLAIDINGDGVTDLVQCISSFSQNGANWTLNLTYHTFLFDGQSSFVSQDAVTYDNVVSGAGSVPTQGAFYVLNLDKSRYPCITFMYEEDSGDWSAVYGMGSSAGQVIKPSISPVASGSNNPNPGRWSISPADINGVGKAGLMLQYFDEQTPCSISPVYNSIELSDFLTTITNPLGLRQEITYAPLSLPNFYDPGPGIDWRTYSPGLAGEDIHILGSSTYLVQQVRTLNDTSINAFPVGNATSGVTGRVQQYSYGGGKLSRSGRGYLGFASFTEHDVTAGVKRISNVSVSWPMAGKVLQEDIYGNSHSDLLTRLSHWPPTDDGNEMQWMQSIFSSYESVQIVSNPSGSVQISNQNNASIWLTRENMTGSSFVQLKDSQNKPVCIFGTDYTYIPNSNQKLSEHSFSRDEVTGEIITEFWKYINPAPAVGGVQILPGTCKQTKSEGTSSSSTYGAGDLSLKTFEYDQTTGVLFRSSIWSSDGSQFVTTQHTFDDFGNQTSELNPDGLTTITTFDPVYHAFPIQKTFTGKNVNMTEHYAYDPRYGTRSMVCSSYGDIEVNLKDEYGRSFQTWRTAAESSEGQVAGSVVQLQPCLVLDPKLAAIFPTSSIYLTKEQTYSSFVSKNGSHFLCKFRTLFNDASTTVADAAQNFVDSEGKVRKVKSQADGLVPVSWQYREYNSQGSQILESYATVLASGQDGADWVPSYQSCNTTILDALERPAISIAPPTQPGLLFTSMETIYTIGDTVRSTNTRQSATYTFNTSDPILEELQYKFTRYNKSLRLVTQTSQTGLIQSYGYDVLGRLQNTIDPANNVDIRSYNSLGNLCSVNNLYNNPTCYDLNVENTDSLPGVGETHDDMGRLKTQTNAENQSTNFFYDGKGRLSRRVDWDNRVTEYVYDDPKIGVDKLASVTISITPSGGPAQIESSYKYQYDLSGRVSSETLEIVDGNAGSYTSLFTYDRQGHLKQKTLPDLSTLNYTWNGSHLASVSLKSPSGENWDVTSTYSNFTAEGQAQTWALTGSGHLKANLAGSSSYDLQRRPIERALSTASQNVLVDYRLHFNALGQIDNNTEKVSNEVIDYYYSDQRLDHSVSSVHGTNSYEYDNSGNMIQKAGTKIVYSKFTDSVGYSSIEMDTTNGAYMSFFDAAGRVISRQLPGGIPTTFTYDGYGKIRTCATGSRGTTTIFSDHTGQTIAKAGASQSMEVYCGSDFSILVQPGGQKLIRRNIFDASLLHVVATVTSQYTGESSTPSGVQLDTYMTDHKGTVTHVFDGTGVLRRKFTYDDYGLLLSVIPGPSPGTLITTDTDSQPCMESKLQDVTTGLIDFSGRWYDPYIGRFTTPDLTLQRKFIQQLDGANLCAFECNDPINRVDPSGHWNWNLFGAIAIAVVLIAVSFVIPGSGILAAAVTGALLGAGVASLTYGIKNRNNTDPKSFWKGWGVDVAIGAATGAATGAAGQWLSGAQCIDSMMGVSSDAITAAREAGTEASQFSARWLVGVGGKTLLGGVSSVGQKVADTEAENAVEGTHQSLSWQDLMITGVEGGITAGFSGLGKGILAPELKVAKAFGKSAVSAFGDAVSSGVSKALTFADDAADDGGFTFSYNLLPQYGPMTYMG